jgi:hypothetical protein
LEPVVDEQIGIQIRNKGRKVFLRGQTRLHPRQHSGVIRQNGGAIDVVSDLMSQDFFRRSF